MARILNILGFLVVLTAVAFAAEWRCNEATCSVINPQGQTVTLTRGTVVATEAGWAVNRADGWQPN